MADKPLDKHKTTMWSKTFGVHADPDGTALNAVKGARDFFWDSRWGGAEVPTVIMGIAGGISGLLAVLGGATLTYDSTTTHTLPPALDAALHAGVEQTQYGVVGFEHDGANYMLIRDGEDYRLFEQDNDNRFNFVSDADDAYAIIRRAGEGMVMYAQALENPDQILSEYKPEILALNDVSAVYESDHGIHRSVTGIEDYAFAQGERFSGVYETQGNILRDVAVDVLDGSYGFEGDEEFDRLGSEERVTTHVNKESQEIMYAGLGILAATLGLGALGGGVAGVSAGRKAARRRRNRGKEHNSYRM